MKFNKLYKALWATTLVMAAAGVAQAGAFQLWEQDAAGIGDYHAGGAAQADSASTEWYNPAGMTRIKHQQLSVGGAGIFLNDKFTGTVTTSLGESDTGTSQGGTSNFVPNLHYVAPINDHWAFGFGVVVPFGLATDYSSSSPASNAATKTKMQVVDITPSIAYRVNQYFSFGAGVDAQHLSGDFDNVVTFSSNTNFNDSNHGSDWGWGFHGGVLIQPSDRTRIGLAYHSQVVHHMRGKSKLSGSSGSVTKDNLKLRVTLPAYTMLSIYQKLNQRWSVMGTVAYTQWDVFKRLQLINVANVLPVSTATIPQNFKNSWNFALGAHYHFSSKWTFQMGAGFDETPTNDTDRNIRLPDNDHYALALGAMYQATKNIEIAGGLTHLFIHKTRINNSNVIAGETVTQVGNVKSSASIVGLQLIWNIT